MSILVVGGHDRMQDMYRSLGSKYGHMLKVYTQMPARFDKAIGSPDAIVLFTKTVSHNMVSIAVKEAKRKGIPVVRCHNSSLASLEDSIKNLEGAKI